MNNFCSDVGIIHIMIAGLSVMAIGIFGLMANRSNTVKYIICTEIILLSLNFIIASLAQFFGKVDGMIASLIIFVVSAAEVAIGIAIIINHYKSKNSISNDSISKLSDL